MAIIIINDRQVTIDDKLTAISRAQLLALAGGMPDANDLIGLIDQQTYDEYRRGDWDLPDDCEMFVTFTAGDLRKLDRILQSYLRACHTGAAALEADGIKSAEVARALDVAECKINAASGTLNTNGESNG